MEDVKTRQPVSEGIAIVTSEIPSDGTSSVHSASTPQSRTTGVPCDGVKSRAAGVPSERTLPPDAEAGEEDSSRYKDVLITVKERVRQTAVQLGRRECASIRLKRGDSECTDLSALRNMNQRCELAEARPTSKTSAVSRRTGVADVLKRVKTRAGSELELRSNIPMKEERQELSALTVSTAVSLNNPTVSSVESTGVCKETTEQSIMSSGVKAKRSSGNPSKDSEVERDMKSGDLLREDSDASVVDKSGIRNDDKVDTVVERPLNRAGRRKLAAEARRIAGVRESEQVDNLRVTSISDDCVSEKLFVPKLSEATVVDVNTEVVVSGADGELVDEDSRSQSAVEATKTAGDKHKPYSSMNDVVDETARLSEKSIRPDERSVLEGNAVNLGVLENLKIDNSMLSSNKLVKKKYSSREIRRLRTEQVAKGKKQSERVVERTKVPIISMTAVKVCAVVAAQQQRKASVHEVGATILSAGVSDNEYIMYLNSDGKVSVDIDSALYEYVQSVKVKYATLRACLEKSGYVVNTADECVFNKEVDGGQCTLLVGINEVLCLCADEEQHQHLADLLRAEFGDTRYEYSDVLTFLGMELNFSLPEKVIVSMTGYERALLDDYKVAGVATSPATNSLCDIDEQSVLLNEKDKTRFSTFVAQLLYIGSRVRPEILVATEFLCSRVCRATEQDNKKLHRVMSYLNSNQCASVELEANERLRVRVFMNASRGVQNNEQRHGVMVTLGTAPVWASSQQQNVKCETAAESDLCCLSDTVKRVACIVDFIEKQGLRVGAATILMNDDTTAVENGQISLDGNRYRKKRFKRMAFLVNNYVKRKWIKFRTIPDDVMVANLFVKPLQGKLFRNLRAAVVSERLTQPRGCVDK